MSTILVTGGCGYLGSQLIRDLAAHSQVKTVRILDNLQQGDFAALTNLPDGVRYELVEDDLMNPLILRHALRDVDVVVHLAAVVKTPLSFEHPRWTEQVNHWGTSRLVEQCLAKGVQRFIFASSASVYGTDGPYSEEAVCRPVGPYAQSKFNAEHVVRMGMERGLKAVILRCGTFYGVAPVTRYSSFANRLAYLGGINRPITVYGSGKQMRPLVHIKDASQAVQLALTDDIFLDRTLNVAATNSSVLDVVEAIQAEKPAVYVHYTEQDALTHFSFSVKSKQMRELGWTPQFTLQDGIGEMMHQFAKIQTISQ